MRGSGGANIRDRHPSRPPAEDSLAISVRGPAALPPDVPEASGKPDGYSGSTSWRRLPAVTQPG